MTRIAAAAALAFLAIAAAPPTPAVRTKPASGGSLVSLISSDDYPPPALRAEEQGLVRVRLDVGIDGKVTACTVIVSSKSASLDSETCRLLQARALFIPARNRRGRPVPDTFTQAIAWRIEEGGLGDSATMIQAWATCLGDDARAHAQDAAGIGTILDRAFERCKPQEEAVLTALNDAIPAGSPPMTAVPNQLREQMRHSIAETLLALRNPRH